MSTPAFPGVSLSEALADWQLVMRSLNRSPETIRTYTTSVVQLDQFTNGGVTVDEVTPMLIRRYLTSVLEAKSASTAVTRSLKSWRVGAGGGEGGGGRQRSERREV